MASVAQFPDNFAQRLPPIGEASTKVGQTMAFIQSFAMWTHPVRAWAVRKAKKAELYDASFQWVRRIFGGAGSADSLQWDDAILQDLQKDWYDREADDIPMPVFNEGFAPRSNESARLLRPEYEPKVVARGSNPNHRRKLTALKATNALKFELGEMHWDHEADLYTHVMPNHGGFWLKTWWDQPWDVITRTPKDGGVKCPAEGCDFKLTKPELSKDEYKQARGKFPPLAVDGPIDATAKIHSCPQCEDHPPLVSWDQTIHEANGADSLGRPAGQVQPLGRPRMRVLTVYDVVARNQGIGVNPTRVPEWVENHTIPLSEAKLYWPKTAADLQPSKSASLSQWDPVLGSPQFRGMPTYRDCVRIFCYYRMPEIVIPGLQADGVTVIPGDEPYMDDGRYLVVADSPEPKVLADGPLMIDDATGGDGQVARAEIEFIPWEMVAGGRMGCTGLSMWDIIFSPQDSRNEVASMRELTRQKFARPFYIAPSGSNLQALQVAGLGDVVYFDTDPTVKADPLQLVNNTTLAPTTEVESNDAKEYIPRAVGYSDAEGGQPPAGVTAATAFNALTKESAERRKPRLRRIEKALQRRYTHMLRMMQHLYAEPRAFYYEDVDGENVEETLSGDEIDDLMSVEVKAVSTYDSEDLKREIIHGAIEDGVINPAESATVRRKLAKEMDVPSVFYEDDNIQEATAEREWFYFYRYDKVPVVDPTLDDAKIHLDCHGKDCNSEIFRAWEDSANWDGALAIIGPTWDLDLKQMQMKIQTAYQLAIMYPQMVQLASQNGMPPPPPPPPLLSTQIQIVQMWADKLAQAGFEPPDPDALNYVLGWRAHMEAHRMEGENRMAMASAGIPQMAPPGAPATASGTTPTPNAPPADMATVMGGTMGGASTNAGSEEGGAPE